MPGETQSREAPAGPWRDWQEAWEVLHETLARIGMPGFEENSEQHLFGQRIPFGFPGPAEMWTHWLSAALPGECKEKAPPELPIPWLEMMEQARAQLQAGESTPAASFEALKEWYDVTSEGWSKTIEEAIGTEQFAATMSRALEGYAGFLRTFRRASEASFSNLQLPTCADIARLAGLVVNLEEKIDRIEDSLEDVLSHLRENRP